MRACCRGGELEVVHERQRGTLALVLVINAIMFLVIATAALHARSSALLSDSLDNLGDALTYGLSLWVVRRGRRAKARVAFFKGLLILWAALAVLVHVSYKLAAPTLPRFEFMGVFSLLALAANAWCLAVLSRHRSDDVNMSSVWECSRNDMVADLSVFAAAAGVWATGSGWPDLTVASVLALFLLRSAGRVLLSAHRALRDEP